MVLSVTKKIKALLIIKNKKPIDLANCLEISLSGVSKKFSSGFFSFNDLMKIAVLTNSNLVFLSKSDHQKVIITSITDLRFFLKKTDTTIAELSNYMEIQPQSLKNKFYRSSFSSIDLIKIANFTDSILMFDVSPYQKIIFEEDDLTTR